MLNGLKLASAVLTTLVLIPNIIIPSAEPTPTENVTMIIVKRCTHLFALNAGRRESVSSLRSVRSSICQCVSSIREEAFVREVRTAVIFIQTAMYHLNQISVGNGTNSENASLVINVRLATMTQSVKTGFYEPAKSRIAFYTHPTAIRGKQLAVVEDLKVVNLCTIKFVYPGKVLKSAILVSPAHSYTQKILDRKDNTSKSGFAEN